MSVCVYVCVLFQLCMTVERKGGEEGGVGGWTWINSAQQILRFLEAVGTTGSFISPSLCLQKTTDGRREEGMEGV